MPQLSAMQGQAPSVVTKERLMEWTLLWPLGSLIAVHGVQAEKGDITKKIRLL